MPEVDSEETSQPRRPASRVLKQMEWQVSPSYRFCIYCPAGGIRIIQCRVLRSSGKIFSVQPAGILVFRQSVHSFPSNTLPGGYYPLTQPVPIWSFSSECCPHKLMNLGGGGYQVNSLMHCSLKCAH